MDIAYVLCSDGDVVNCNLNMLTPDWTDVTEKKSILIDLEAGERVVRCFL